MRKLKSPEIPLGLVSIAVGIFCYCISLGVIPVEAHTPLWVIGLVGLLFLSAGLSVLGGRYLSSNSLPGSFILMLFSLIGFGIGFFTESGTTIKIITGVFSTLFLFFSIKLLTTKHEEDI